MGIQAKRVLGVVKLSRKYKLDCVDLQGRSREGTKKRALENGNKKHKNYRVKIWAGGALLFVYMEQTENLIHPEYKWIHPLIHPTRGDHLRRLLLEFGCFRCFS